MKRFVIVLAAVLTTALCAATAVLAAGVAPRVRLRDFVCLHALDPSQRSVSVDAVMRPVAHTKKMEIKFVLLQKAGTERTYNDVRGGDLGSWLTPVGQPTLGQRPGDVWSISHPVTGLPAPDVYRYRVVFRWYGDRARVLATQTLTSPKCFQPELRPDLIVASIAVGQVPNHPKQASYTALIRNAGATAAGPFDLVFTPGGSAVSKTRTVALLGARQSRQLTFIGPACTSATAPTVSVDPTHQVDVSSTANETLVASC